MCWMLLADGEYTISDPHGDDPALDGSEETAVHDPEMADPCGETDGKAFPASVPLITGQRIWIPCSRWPRVARRRSRAVSVPERP